MPVGSDGLVQAPVAERRHTVAQVAPPGREEGRHAPVVADDDRAAWMDAPPRPPPSPPRLRGRPAAPHAAEAEEEGMAPALS